MKPFDNSNFEFGPCLEFRIWYFVFQPDVALCKPTTSSVSINLLKHTMSKKIIALQVSHDVQSLIFSVRGERVILDGDLAAIYGVPTKRLNEQVRRNSERFPEDFCFRLTSKEVNSLRSQIATASHVVRGIRSHITTARNVTIKRKCDCEAS